MLNVEYVSFEDYFVSGTDAVSPLGPATPNATSAYSHVFG
jgi:hypothetical protein